MTEQTWVITLRRQMMECDSWLTLKQDFSADSTTETVNRWAKIYFPGWGIEYLELGYD